MNTRIWMIAAALTLPVACVEDAEPAEDGAMADEDTGEAEGEAQPAYEGYPYLSNHFELESGLNMHYLDEGSGDPIVLVHGVPTQAYLWRNMIPTLAEHGRVIVPDMINFGLSDKTEPLTPEAHAENLAELVAGLELENVTFVLQDWGVPFGFAAARMDPDRAGAFVFFEGPALPLPSLDIVPDFMFGSLIDPATAYPAIIDDNWFIECFLLDPECVGSNAREWTDAERAVYRAPFVDPASREQLALMPQHLPFVDTTGHPALDPDGPGGDPAQPSPSIEMVSANAAYMMGSELPKLFIYGEPGLQPGGAMAGAQMQAIIPNLSVAGVGSAEQPTHHFIQEDAPVELAETIGEFIAAL